MIANVQVVVDVDGFNQVARGLGKAYTHKYGGAMLVCMKLECQTGGEKVEEVFVNLWGFEEMTPALRSNVLVFIGERPRRQFSDAYYLKSAEELTASWLRGVVSKAFCDPDVFKECSLAAEPAVDGGRQGKENVEAQHVQRQRAGLLNGIVTLGELALFLAIIFVIQ